MFGGRVHVFTIQLVPLLAPAAVTHASGTVHRRTEEPAGNAVIPKAVVTRSTKVRVGDEVNIGDRLTLSPGSRLTIRLSDGEVSDFIAPWDDERYLSFLGADDLHAR